MSASDITLVKVTEAISTIVDFFEQEVKEGKLRDGELKMKIEELKTSPQFQEKLERCERKKGKHLKKRMGLLEKCDENINIGKFSRLVAMMVRFQYKGQDDCDDDEDEAN